MNLNGQPKIQLDSNLYYRGGLITLHRGDPIEKGHTGP